MDFAEQNPRAGTLARPYDYFIDSLRPQQKLRPFSVLPPKPPLRGEVARRSRVGGVVTKSF